MTLITPTQRKKLLANFAPNPTTETRPVVCLMLPDYTKYWLLTQLAPRDQDTAYGLTWVNRLSTDVGYVSLVDIASLGAGRLSQYRPRVSLAHYKERSVYMNLYYKVGTQHRALSPDFTRVADADDLTRMAMTLATNA